MTQKLFSLPATAQGVNHEIVEEDGRIFDVWRQDCEAILKRNAELESSGSGYSQDKTFRRVASVPVTMIQKIHNDTGIDFHSEECAKQVLRLLDSNEYYRLRTAPGRLF